MMARIIKAAKGEAEPSRAQVARRVEEAEEQAEALVRQAGHEGYEQGRQEAQGMLDQVQELERQLIEQTDRRIQGAAQTLVEDLLRAEVADADGFLDMIRHSLRAMRRGREIFLRVHPDRAQYLQTHRDSLVAVLGRARTIEIREDISLALDGCVVETDAGVLDVGLETQLSALFEGVDR
ncbi:MAG: FliH/SctL family protein [Myxococcota bacterium]|jgi:flagellar assembly protein FliH|nr:FliH/SctL family protein [Myxococcota bacterium]